MTKLVQNDLASLTNEQSALAALNANYASLEVFSDTVLSRDGTSPNEMLADLDMNSHRILNLPEPVNALEPVRLQDIGTLNGGGSVGTVQANYVTTVANSSLTNERILAVGTGLSLTDSGAGNNITIAPANDLAAVEGLSTTGLVTRTATDTWTTRTLTAPAAGITITNPAGIAGNPTFALANDLNAIESLAGNGIVARTATDTMTTRTVTGTANEITLTNGDGVSGNPTVSIPTSVTFTGKTITGGTYSGPAITGTCDIQQNLQFSGDISPTSFSTQQDNYNPTNLATSTTLRLTATANSNITGLSGGTDGRIIVIHNVSTGFNIVLKDESASSTAGNRFALTADNTLAPDNAAVLQYDSTSSRWRVLGGTGSSSTSQPVFNIKVTYGAVGDYKGVSDAAMNTGSTTLTSATAGFTAGDVGKYIAVAGAGAAGVSLFTTIAAFTNSTTITLTAPNASGGNISAKIAEWGTDDTAAFNAAIAAAFAAGGGVAYFPPGNYFVTRINMANMSGVKLLGEASSRIFPMQVAAYTGTAGHVIDCTGSAFIKLEGFQLGAFYTLAQPQTGIFIGQVASAAANRILIEGLYVSGQYLISTLYVYGSPSSVILNSDFYNYKAGAGTQNCMVLTKDNRSSLTSSFATVTSGALSTSDWLFSGCEWHKFAGAGANNEVVLLDQVTNIAFVSGVISGGASQYVSFDSGTNSSISFYNVTFETEGEPVAPTNAYNFLAGSTVAGLDTFGTSYIISGTISTGSGTREFSPKVSIQSFTGSGTYTPATGMIYCIIEAQGAGGGGGGAAASSTGFSCGGGGGAGSLSVKRATAAEVGASQTVTIGTAGTAGATGNNAGGTGGDTSVGSLCIGKGGSGGSGAASNASGQGGAGGVAGTGDVTSTGMPGFTGPGAAITTVAQPASCGGSSRYGGGAPGNATGGGAVAGTAGTGKGSGGGGGYSFASASTAAGGAGTAGIVVITEFSIGY